MFNSGYCRLCGEIKKYSNLSVIKNEDEYSKNLCYQISQCFQIQISDDDNLPKTICFDCCTQTNVSYEFFHKVQRAQEFLRNVVCNPLLNYPAADFIQPVVGLVTNENNIEELIETRVKNDTSAEQDTQHSDSDELWDYESSTDSTNVQSSSTSKVLEENITKVDKQPQKYRAGKIKIKNEINSNELNGLQLDNVNEVQSTEKNPVTRKRKRNKKIRETKQKRCKDEDNQEICEELKDYTWSCNVCFDKLETRQNLIEHFQQKHNKPVEYSCSDCPRTLSNYAVFVQHVERHRNEAKFCCEECGKIFNENRSLTRHVNYVHGRIQFKCDICNKIYKSKAGFENHKKEHLPKNPEPIKFPCKICHKKLLTEDDLIEHEKIHDESNKHFTCEKCGSRFRVIRNLEEHMENVHVEYSEDQYFQCPLCPSKLKNEKQLIRHKREIHSAKKRFECETCGKEFYLLSKFKFHLTLHTGERRYKCQHCEKRFRLKAQLENHIRQHTGEKPYCCFDCVHYFTDFANYIKHMRRKHGVTSFKNVKKITDVKIADIRT